MKHIINTITNNLICIEGVNVHQIEVFIYCRKGLEVLCNLKIMILVRIILCHCSTTKSKNPKTEYYE